MAAPLRHSFAKHASNRICIERLRPHATVAMWGQTLIAKG
ncbi:hypothetical protein RKLH11_1298 [Rhodobacteraceae bacterium KLH11]|nr:hypothetical protein RKLH11_1298 [Rhodobacteraceae bacterium KLH11]